MPLGRKQKEAIKAYVDLLAVEAGGKLGNVFDPHGMQILSDSLMQAQPWKELLDWWELTRLLDDRLSRFGWKLPSDYVGALGSMPDATLRDSIAADLIAYLDSLPRSYFVCFQVDRFPRIGQAELSLGSGVSLIDTGAGFNENLVEGRGTLLRAGLRHDTMYLRFFVTGYASSNPESNAVAKAVAKLKHFAFIGLRTEALHQKGIADLFMARAGSLPTLPDGFVYSATDGRSEAHRIGLADHFQEYFRWLQFNENKLTVLDLSAGTGATLLTAPEVAAVTPEQKATAIKNAFDTAMQFLDIRDDDRDSERLCAAMEWAMDAKMTSNETMAFLQRCIGLEAILGSDDRARGITDRLSDRYAYLLGGTQTERERLKQEFEGVYNQRSAIVHSRRPRIAINTWTAVGPEIMLSNVIGKEVAELLRDRRRKQEAAR